MRDFSILVQHSYNPSNKDRNKRVLKKRSFFQHTVWWWIHWTIYPKSATLFVRVPDRLSRKCDCATENLFSNFCTKFWLNFSRNILSEPEFFVSTLDDVVCKFSSKSHNFCNTSATPSEYRLYYNFEMTHTVIALRHGKHPIYLSFQLLRWVQNKSLQEVQNSRTCSRFLLPFQLCICNLVSKKV